MGSRVRVNYVGHRQALGGELGYKHCARGLECDTKGQEINRDLLRWSFFLMLCQMGQT